MRRFDYQNLPKELLTEDIIKLTGNLREYRGRQNLYIEQAPEALEALCEVAKIQSTGASNRIEGIFTTDGRLQQLMAQKVTPRNRNEQEIAGYRDVLQIIHESYDAIPVTPNYILQLHKILYSEGNLSFGGKWKDSDNAIIEIDAEGNRRVRFRPTPAVAVPDAMDNLCRTYNEAISAGKIEPVLLAALFTFDFVCIHPFNDGNGRMSRLLMLLLLYRSGYLVGKYISIEKEIERSKETYYEALQASSNGWSEGENDYLPFVSYFLWSIGSAYQKFEDRVEGLVRTKLSKSQRVERAVREHLGSLSKSEIATECPDISLATIEAALSNLLKAGKIEKLGASRATKYRWIGE